MFKKVVILFIVIFILTLSVSAVLDNQDYLFVYKPVTYANRVGQSVSYFPTPWKNAHTSTFDEVLDWLSFPGKVIVWIAEEITSLIPVKPNGSLNDIETTVIYIGPNAFNHYVDAVNGDNR